MKNLIDNCEKILVLGLLASLVALSYVQAEPMADVSNVTRRHIADIIRIDFRSRTIDRLPVDTFPKEFKTKLGAKNVQLFNFESEGEQQEGYRLRFNNGETVNLYESFVEITSKDFRTDENLGVGSTWEQFQNAYADGELSWMSDANAIWSEKYKFRLYFKESKRISPSANDQIVKIHISRSARRW